MGLFTSSRKPAFYHGNLFSCSNEFEEARQAYQEALEIYRSLAAVNPQTYLPDVAMTLNNFGNLLMYVNEFEEAKQAYKEALGIRRNWRQSTSKLTCLM